MSLDIKEIDDQHQQFLKILNDLYDAFYQMRYKDELQGLLRQLCAFADYHFATEEKYFDLFKYDHEKEHKQIHAKLGTEIQSFIERFERGETDLIADLMDFLEDWLVNHLQTEDKRYVACFHEHGLH